MNMHPQTVFDYFCLKTGQTGALFLPYMEEQNPGEFWGWGC